MQSYQSIVLIEKMPKINKSKEKPERELRTDGEITRNRILEAAGEMFAAKGYAEASNKEIAATAEVDLASINYHFGNRSGLYQAALIEAHHRLAGFSQIERLIKNENSPEEKLLAFINYFVGNILAEPHPWHLQLLAREMFAPSSHLESLFTQEAEPKQLLLKQLLSELTGTPIDEPILMQCLFSVSAPFLMLLVSKNISVGSLRTVSQIPRESLASYLYSFTLGGLEAIAEQWRKG